MSAETSQRRTWSRHWSHLDTRARARSLVLSGGRRIIAGSLAATVERHFPAAGVFVHAGSGTAESDASIVCRERTLVALDFVLDAVRMARRSSGHHLGVVADLGRLPFKSDSLDGIWNLGVHEHFSPEENRRAFREFARVLKPGGKVLVFWPAKRTPYMLLKDLAEWCVRRYSPDFRFFPDEINKATSRAHVRRELESGRLRVLSVSLSWRDLFVYYVVVAEKPGTGAPPA
jgi:SAM-dependent methyltransferase